MGACDCGSVGGAAICCESSSCPARGARPAACAKREALLLKQAATPEHPDQIHMLWMPSQLHIAGVRSVVTGTEGYVIGIINLEKFKELQKEKNLNDNTIYYRDTPVFADPRNEELGARVLSNLEKLYLTIKKLNLKIINLFLLINLIFRIH